MGYENIKGLSLDEVNERIEKGLDNKELKNTSRTVWQIIGSNLFTYFNLIFLILGILLIIAKKYKSLTFIPIILINMIIGIVQELKSKRLIDKLSFLSAPNASVIRDGKVCEVKVHQLVKDDVVIFKAGNQIPADAVVIHGNAYLNESLLTGEADEIEKNKDDILMSGSFVVSGEVVARLTKVGKDSYISQLTIKAKSQKAKDDSEIKKALNKILGIIGIIIIPLGIIQLLLSIFVRNTTFSEAVSSMTGSLVMMIPEGLFLLASVTLAISAYKLAKKNVLIQSMNSIETLARVNVFCIDKTGTITDNNMQVNDFISLNGMDKNDLFKEISSFAYYQDVDNITMKAIKEFFDDKIDYEFVNKTSFSSEFKYSAVNFKDFTYIVGAPEFVLRESFDKYKDRIYEFSKDGYRVLVVAKSKTKATGKALSNDLVPIGLIILANSIRPNAPQTFEYFASQGVEIKVISGDSAITVSNVAKRAKIKNYDKYIDCTNLSDEDVLEASQKYTVFGRVTPELKQKLIIALKSQGNKVAMTGDGVNDVLALKEADCSVAMASGSDAAVKASQVVLVDSDFSKMPDIVYEGRRVVNNLERSGSLFITKNIFAILFTMACIFGNMEYPIKPNQAAIFNTFTIGLPSFLMSQVPNKEIIKGKFVPNIMRIAIPSGVAEAFMLIALAICARYNHLDNVELSALSTLLISNVGMVVVFNIARPYTKYKLTVCLISVIGLFLNFFIAFFFETIRSFYDFTLLSHTGWKLFIILSFVSIVIYVLLSYLFNKIKIKTPYTLERDYK